MMIVEIVSVLLFVVLSLFVYTFATHFLEDKRLPPGPIPFPLVGNMFHMGLLPHLGLTALAKKYGEIFKLQIGIHRIVVVNSIESAREALVRRSNDFAGRPLLHTASLISRRGKSIAFGNFDTTWKMQRKIAHSALKMFGSGIESLEAKICIEIDELVERLSQKEGIPFDPAHDIQLAVLNIICSFVFGSRYTIDDPEFHSIIRYTDRFSQGFRAGNLVDYFPWLRFFPNKGLSLIKEAIAERDTLLQRKYQEHYDTYQEDTTRDLTDALIKATRASSQEDKTSSPLPFTEDNIIMTMSDIFSGGIETMSTCLLWAIVYLVRNPKIQEQIHKDLDEVVGRGRMPELGDRSKLPFVDATIAETMRFSSLVPLLFPHSTIVDTFLNGYFIPEGTVVLFNTWAMHHDREKWSNPDTFDPTRFLDSDGKLVSPATLSYLPFSAGRRVCLAETLAKIQLFLFNSRLLHKFEFRIPESSSTPDLEGIFGASLTPKPFEILAHKRF